MRSYRELLAEIDAWYQRAKREHPQQIPCSIGCRDCCLGLFEITPADRTLLRQGLRKLDARTRTDIERRAEAILIRLRTIYPDLGGTLEGYSPQEIDELCEHLGAVECPVLGPKSECRLYEHRPMVCRLAGIPVVDVSGRAINPEGCGKCTLKPKNAPRLDHTSLRRRERAILKRSAPNKPGVTMLIPQALTALSRRSSNK